MNKCDGTDERSGGGIFVFIEAHFECSGFGGYRRQRGCPTEIRRSECQAFNTTNYRLRFIVNVIWIDSIPKLADAAVFDECYLSSIKCLIIEFLIITTDYITARAAACGELYPSLVEVLVDVPIHNVCDANSLKDGDVVSMDEHEHRHIEY